MSEEQQKLIKLASYFSVVTASIILIAKIYGWFATESQSMLASLIDSMLDVSSSFINVIAIRFAMKPPDHEHRFGHEKYQDLAVFSQAIFFIVSSLFTLFSSSRALFEPRAITNSDKGIEVMYLCIVLTVILVAYQTYVLRKTKSMIIAADKLHYFTDFLTNIVVIISIYFSERFWFIDPLFGIAISLYIMHASYGLFKASLKNLVDEEFSNEDRAKIVAVISNFKNIKGLHDLKTRHAADKAFIQLHLEMEGNMSLFEAHIISDQISLEIEKVFPGSEIIIHQDPEGVEHHVNYREQIR